MMWSVWLAIAMVSLLVAWRVFSSKPDHTESDREELEREHRKGVLNDADYEKKKAALPH